MLGRTAILNTLLGAIEDMLSQIEENEHLEPDFAVMRELAEQLKEEIESLQE